MEEYADILQEDWNTLVYRNSRIIATNRPAATRTHPRQTTVE